mgnify:CR=1 FL=1
MLISAIAIIVMAICAMVLFYDILKKQIFDDLKANAHVISMMNPEDLPDEINYNLNKDGLRITLINEDGTVIYDSMEDESKMENHRERPEIASALAAGEGRAMRKSTTSAKHTFYYAMRTDDGKVLRIGKDSNSIYSLIIKMVYLTLSVGFCVFVLCTVLAHRLTRRLVAPIEKMADNIVLLEENDVYDEMKPFVATIKQQHVDILKHSQMRQEFTANVSHELKTPLHSIIGSAELLENDLVKPGDTKKFIGNIKREVTRLVTLINDIIELSKLDENSEIPKEPVDIYDVADEVVDVLSQSAQKKNVDLILNGEHCVIDGIRRYIYEIIYNLCDNAVRYNKDGGSVTININKDITKNGENVVLSVSDTGIGIPVEHQGRIFERFYRADKSHSRETGGTGLGLSIVKHAVAYHNGTIKLESKPGKGTTITVKF